MCFLFRCLILSLLYQETLSVTSDIASINNDSQVIESSLFVRTILDIYGENGTLSVHNLTQLISTVLAEKNVINSNGVDNHIEGIADLQEVYHDDNLSSKSKSCYATTNSSNTTTTSTLLSEDCLKEKVCNI